MGQRSLLVVLIAVAAGCGDNDSAPDPGPDLNEGATSGTRLKLRYYDFGNVRELAGVRDAQRSEDCTPSEWADGNAYCVPTSAGSLLYQDPSCTERVGVVPMDPVCTRSPPSYFVDYLSTACDTKLAHIYPRAAKLAVTEVYSKNSNGSCSGPSSSARSDVYALGAEIAVADLAEITITSPSMTGRLGQRYYESPDGLHYPVPDRVRDAMLGGECSLSSDAPGSDTGSCLPSKSAGMYQFSDAACTQSHVTVDSACPAPKVATNFAACPYDPPRYYALGALLTLTTVYYQAGMTCSPTPASPAESYYGVGAEVALAQATRTRGTGAGRLQPIHFTTPEGLLHRDTTLFDSQIGVECSVRQQADGSVACVPPTGQTQTYYTDAGCTTAVDLMQVYRRDMTCSPAPAPAYAIKYNFTASCEAPLYEVRHVGAQLTSALYVKNGTACNAANQAFVRYQLADVVPQSELAAGTLVTEP